MSNTGVAGGGLRGGREERHSMRAMLEALEPRQFMTAADAAEPNKYIVPVVDSVAKVELVGDLWNPVVASGIQTMDKQSGPQIGLPTMQTNYPSNLGGGYRVVVIDTGADLDHPYFGIGAANRIVYDFDFAADAPNPLYGGAYIDDDASDTDGHGSNVASIIGSEDSVNRGVAPGVDLIILKVFNSLGQSYVGSVESALNWVVQNGKAFNVVAVNLSLGNGENFETATKGDWNGYFEDIDELGIVTVAAMGNDYAGYKSQGADYPAADPYVLGVGAVYDATFPVVYDTDGATIIHSPLIDEVAYFSQRSTELTDIFAPGYEIEGASWNGGTVTSKGTSQAAPAVAGLVAVAQDIAWDKLGRKLTPTEFRSLIQVTGKQIFDSDAQSDYVPNTDEYFKRIDASAMANAITSMFDQGVSGVVWDDLNENGVQDTGEPGVGGVKVFIDSTNNDLWDTTETFTTTDSFGRYILPKLAAGNYSIEISLPTGVERVNMSSTSTWTAPTYTSVAGGFTGANDVAVSDDGKFVYMANSGANSVTVYSRNLSTNALTGKQTVADAAATDGLAGAYSVVISPDGLNVYVSGQTDNAIACFSRDTTTGLLTYLGKVTDPALIGVRGLSFMRNDTLYAVGNGSDTVMSFRRATVDGRLTRWGSVETNGVNGVVGLDGATDIAIYGPNYFQNRYVVSSSATNPTTQGELLVYKDYGTQLLQDGIGGVDGLAGARSVTVSPDGKNVYVASELDNAVAIFSRASDGELKFMSTIKSTTVPELAGAWDVEVSPDGGTVFVTGSTADSLVWFTRSQVDGSLTFVSGSKLVDGVSAVNGLNGAHGIAVAPDGHGLFVAGSADNSVAWFTRLGSNNVKVDNGHAYTPMNFSVRVEKGTISGNVWHDQTVLNGLKDGIESTIGNVRVYLDLNNNGAWEFESEPSRATETDGSYSFIAPTGRYRVGVVLPTGLTLAGPGWAWSDKLTQSSAIAEAAPTAQASNIAISAGFAAWGNNTGTIYVATRAATGVLSNTKAYLEPGVPASTNYSIRDIAISQDSNGTFLYVTGTHAATMSVYKVGTSNVLSLVQTITNGVLGLTNMSTPYGVEVSPDGEMVYVTDVNGGGQGRFFAFTRDPANGKLTAVQDVAKAPDAYGAIAPINITVIAPHDGMDEQIVVSGQFMWSAQTWVYKRSASDVVTFSSLLPSTAGPDEIDENYGTGAASSDGKFFYQASGSHPLSYNVNNGSLSAAIDPENHSSYAHAHTTNNPPRPSNMAALSPDGEHFVVANYQGVEIYRVDTVTRGLMYTGFFPVEKATSVAFSPNGQQVYVLTEGSGVRVLTRAADAVRRVTVYSDQETQGTNFGLRGTVPSGSTVGSGWFQIPQNKNGVLNVSGMTSGITTGTKFTGSEKLAEVWPWKKGTDGQGDQQKSGLFQVFKDVFSSWGASKGGASPWSLKMLDLGEAIGEFRDQGYHAED